MSLLTIHSKLKISDHLITKEVKHYKRAATSGCSKKIFLAVYKCLLLYLEQAQEKAMLKSKAT